MLYFLIALLIIAAAIGGHLLFPLIGAAVAVSAGLWGVIIASVVLFCLAIVLFFIFSGVGMLVVGAFSVVWVVIAIVLFPILFPILLPLLILLAFIGCIRKKQQQP